MGMKRMEWHSTRFCCGITGELGQIEPDGESEGAAGTRLLIAGAALFEAATGAWGWCNRYEIHPILSLACLVNE
jgi:hypothetical protein